MNKQREIIYELRRNALLSEEPSEVLFGIIDQVVEELVLKVVAGSSSKDGNKLKADVLAAELNNIFPLEFKADFFTDGITDGQVTDMKALTLQIIGKIENAYTERNAEMEEADRTYLQRHTVLEAIDRLWQEHLYAMDQLRASMSLRVYAQKDPLVEYKNEAFDIFKTMMDNVYMEVAKNLFRITIRRILSFEEQLAAMPQELRHQIMEQFGLSAGGAEEQPAEEPAEEVHITFHRETPKVGRNDFCPCGSGKKYKKCCGKEQ
jgi:preprotein translocase subunit SecA